MDPEGKGRIWGRIRGVDPVEGFLRAGESTEGNASGVTLVDWRNG